MLRDGCVGLGTAESGSGRPRNGFKKSGAPGDAGGCNHLPECACPSEVTLAQGTVLERPRSPEPPRRRTRGRSRRMPRGCPHPLLVPGRHYRTCEPLRPTRYHPRLGARTMKRSSWPVRQLPGQGRWSKRKPLPSVHMPAVRHRREQGARARSGARGGAGTIDCRLIHLAGRREMSAEKASYPLQEV